MKNMIKMAFEMWVMRAVRKRIRVGGLKALRLYIQFIQQLRIATMTAALAVACVAASVVGVGFIVAGILMALPISVALLPYVFIGFGSFVVLLVAIGLRVVLNEQRWLEKSQAYALMNKVDLDTYPPLSMTLANQN
jgi:hypothetical protein